MTYIKLDNRLTNQTVLACFRKFEPKDAQSVIDCIREAYGDNYCHPNYYNPNYLIELNESGKTEFLIAEIDNGEVAGILALNPKGRTCGLATGIVQKKYHGFRILEYLLDIAIDEIQKTQNVCSLYARTVMHHSITHHILEKINFVPCGFLLGEFLTYEQCNDDVNLKQPNGFFVRNMSKAKADKIYICSEHNEFVQNIYKSLQVDVEIDNNIYDLTDNSKIQYENDESEKFCSIFVNVPGKDTIDKIKAIENKFAAPLETFNVFLNMNHKSANLAYEKLKGAGYFFSGVMPICAENEFMIMHNPKNVAINFDKFAVTDKFSKVKDYVKKYYLAV